MLNLRPALRQTQTKSVLDLRSALSSQRSSVTQLLQINLIHQHYLSTGGRDGPFGFPTSEVQFSGDKAIRQFRGGEIRVLGDNIQGDLPKLVASVRFLGFRCVKESTWDQGTTNDEPYFIISADTGNGAPAVKKFGEYEGIGTDDEIGVGEFLIKDVAPNPMAIRVVAYENDHGDPDKTAREIQDEVVKLSQQAGSLSSAAAAADGPGIGPAAAAGTVGGIAAGPIGALIAVGIVTLLGLGDDFVGQAATLLFARPENVGEPPREGEFQGMDYNRKIYIDGGKEGKYDLFFDIHVQEDPPSHTYG